MDYLLNIGIAITATAVVGAIITAVILKIYAVKLNRKLDSEYGKL